MRPNFTVFRWSWRRLRRCSPTGVRRSTASEGVRTSDQVDRTGCILVLRAREPTNDALEIDGWREIAKLEPQSGAIDSDALGHRADIQRCEGCADLRIFLGQLRIGKNDTAAANDEQNILGCNREECVPDVVFASASNNQIVCTAAQSPNPLGGSGKRLKEFHIGQLAQPARHAQMVPNRSRRGDGCVCPEQNRGVTFCRRDVCGLSQKEKVCRRTPNQGIECCKVSAFKGHAMDAYQFAAKSVQPNEV